MSKSLQKIAEEKTYDILFDLADEFNLNVPFLPEVYYVHKNFKFESLGIPAFYKDYFSMVLERKGGVYLENKQIILLGSFKDYAIGEEVGHFLHFSNSKNFHSTLRNDLDYLFFSSITEMIGFFFSKLVDGGRKNVFVDKEEYLPKKTKNLKKVLDSFIDSSFFDIFSDLDEIYIERFIYEQGYGLGEKLFDYYLSGLFSKKDLLKLVKKPLKKPFEATGTFFDLKYNVLV
jgi:hypothetical protein